MQDNLVDYHAVLHREKEEEVRRRLEEWKAANAANAAAPASSSPSSVSAPPPLPSLPEEEAELLVGAGVAAKVEEERKK